MKRRRSQRADVLHEPQQYDPASSRPCLACGHAVPHNSSEDVDGAPYNRCSHITLTREACENPHKRYSAKCAKRDVIDSCWISAEPCECTEEDRVIADQRAHILELNSAISKAVVLGALGL